MKKAIVLALMGVSAVVCLAQSSRFPPINLYTGDPTGNACTGNIIQQSSTTGKLYTCQGGTMQAGSGSGSVSGQTSGTIPLATGSTAIGSPSHLTDNGTVINSTLPISVTGCGAGTVIKGDGTGCVTPGGVPGGSNLQLQFNNSGAFGGATGISTDSATKSVLYDASTAPSAAPIVDIRNPAFAGGAICDGTFNNDIGPALQAAWSAVPSGGGRIQIVGNPNLCYWANPTTFDWSGKAGPVEIYIQGQLRIGSTLSWPSGVQVNWIGTGGVNYSQFQSPGSPGFIFVRPALGPATGTIGLNVAQGGLLNVTAGVTSGSPTVTITTTTTVAVGMAISDNRPSTYELITTPTGSGFIPLGTTITAISGTCSSSCTLTMSANATGTNASDAIAIWLGTAVLPLSGMKGIYPGAAITVAGLVTCTFTSISRSGNVATGTFASPCPIYPGSGSTVAGVADSTFNGTGTGNGGNFLVLSSDQTTNTMTWKNTGTNAVSSGGTITGLNGNTVESVPIVATTASTATVYFMNPHASTDQFGLVGINVYNNGAQSLLQDLHISADGTVLLMQNTYKTKLNRIGITGSACSGNYTNFPVELNWAGFTQVDGSSIGESCLPWAFRMLQPFYVSYSGSGPLYMDNSFLSGPLKLDHSGGSVFVRNSTFEQPTVGAVIFDATGYSAATAQQITLENDLMQDNPNGYQQCAIYAVTSSSGNGLGQGFATVDRMGQVTCIVNDYYTGTLSTAQPSVPSRFSLLANRGVRGFYQNGSVVDAEVRGEQAGMSPAVIPYATGNVTTTPSSWPSSPCTLTPNVMGPDGTLSAGSLSIAASSSSISPGSYGSYTPTVGDQILFGGWVYSPTYNVQPISQATGTSFIIDTNSSTHFQIDGSFQGKASSLIYGDWWTPVVGHSTITSTDGTGGQTIKLYMNCTADRVLTYYDPFLIVIPAVKFTATTDGSTAVLTSVSSTTGLMPDMVISGAGIPTNSFILSINAGASTVTINTPTTAAASGVAVQASVSNAEIARWRRQNLHGYVGANLPAGALSMNPAHKLYWGSDTNIYRGGASLLQTDDTFQAPTVTATTGITSPLINTTVYIAPSGDTTGGVDVAAINTACAAGKSIELGVGKYYIGKANVGITISSSPPCSIKGQGPGLTFIQNEGTTDNLITVSYQQGIGNNFYHGTTLRGFQMIQDPGVTQTAGFGLVIGSGIASPSTSFAFNGRFEDITMQGLYDGIKFQSGQLTMFLSNVFVAGLTDSTNKYGILYDSATGAGDDDINVQLAGVNACIVINQADRTLFRHFKVNGCQTGVKFLRGNAAESVEFDGGSIEGTGSGTAYDFGTGGTAPTHITIVGGETAIMSTAFTNIANAPFLCVKGFINRNDPQSYGGGGTMDYGCVVSNSSITCTAYTPLVFYDGSCASSLPTSFQARDTFVGIPNTSLTAHTANSGQSWVDWARVGDCAVVGKMILTLPNVVTNTCNTGNTTAYLNFTPTSADHNVCFTGTPSGFGATGLWDHMVAGALTGNELLYISGTGLQLYQVSAGTATQLGSTHAYTWTGVHTLCLASSGTTVSGTLDGAALSGITGTTTVTTNGFTGLRLGQASPAAIVGSFTVQ